MVQDSERAQPSASARTINNGNRTEWSPIRSVIIRVIKQNRTTAKRESDLLIKSMITD